MAFDDDQILQDYIARLLSVQDTREDLIEEADLQVVARDLGLSERDLARAEAIAEAHRQRGKNFARHRAWDEAIAELRQAMVLAPLDVPLLYELAVAHASRYEASGQPEDRSAAYAYAQRCTQLDPQHQPSFALISALGKTPQENRNLTPVAPNRRSVIVAVALALLGVAVVSYFMAEQPATTVPALPETIDPPSIAVSPEAPADLSRERQLPIDFSGPDREGLVLEVQRSQFNDYDSSFAYKLHATMLSEQAELHQLQLTLDLLDAEGRVLVSKPFKARSNHEAPLRPGDTAPIGELVFEKRPPPAVESVRLSVTHIEREPAASDYGRSPLVPLIWDVPQPAIDIDARERENSLRANFDRYLHFLAFAVRNNGPRTVERLRWEVVWRTATGEEIMRKSLFVVAPSGPGLRAGATWVVRTIGTLPEAEQYDHYTVRVTEAE